MFNNSRKTAFAAIVAAGLAAVAVATMGGFAAGAADEPANVIAYRQKVMTAIVGHIGAIASVLKGEVSYTDHVASHAKSLHATSLMLDDIFPEGSGVGETRAKPEIWRERVKFDAAVKAFQDASAGLARVAEGGDMAAIGAALGKVGESCGGCHKPFRKEKK